MTLKHLRIFFLGLFVSFAGSLPLGTMNVAAAQLTVRDGISAAFIYATGSMVIEIIYVRLIMGFMQWIHARIKLFSILGTVTALILLVMAAASFYAAAHKQGISNALPVFSQYHFFYGAMLSAINPLHVPFWFGWSTVLMDKGWLLPEKNNYNIYVAGIGLGTMSGFAVFIYGGNYLVGVIKDKQYILNWMIGIILLVTSLIQLYKTIKQQREARECGNVENVEM